MKGGENLIERESLTEREREKRGGGVFHLKRNALRLSLNRLSHGSQTSSKSFTVVVNKFFPSHSLQLGFEHREHFPLSELSLSSSTSSLYGSLISSNPFECKYH